jgi:hypothetical protein
MSASDSKPCRGTEPCLGAERPALRARVLLGRAGPGREGRSGALALGRAASAGLPVRAGAVRVSARAVAARAAARRGLERWGRLRGRLTRTSRFSWEGSDRLSRVFSSVMERTRSSSTSLLKGLPSDAVKEIDEPSDLKVEALA